MDDSSSSLASISVGLELVTQHFLIAVELTHVEHTTSDECKGVYNMDALPGKKKKRLMLREILCSSVLGYQILENIFTVFPSLVIMCYPISYTFCIIKNSFIMQKVYAVKLFKFYIDQSLLQKTQLMSREKKM